MSDIETALDLLDQAKEKLQDNLGEKELETQLTSALRYGGFSDFLLWLNSELNDQYHLLGRAIKELENGQG